MQIGILTDNLGIATAQKIYNWNQLLQTVTRCKWSPSVFQDGIRRNDKFLETNILALDIDEGLGLDQALKIFKDYKHIIATTKSHGKAKNGVTCDRYRVILFLEETCTNAAALRATWYKAYEKYPFIDPACKDPARFYYPCKEVVSQRDDGKLISIEEPTEAEAVVATKNPEVQDVKGELTKKTLEFLLEGAPAGTRHNRLVKAVMNMREQGYDEIEVQYKVNEMIERTGNWGTASLNAKDKATISDIFTREVKYEYQPPQEDAAATAAALRADSLLDSMFEYIKDKDLLKGNPTGIKGLDKMLGGGKRLGELSVLMAQAKTGKNSLYHYLLYQQLDKGIGCGYASRELDPGTEVLPNLITAKYGINLWTETLSGHQQRQIENDLKKWELYFAPGYGYFPIEQMRAWFTELAHEGIEYFLFDHFHYALLKEDHDSTSKLIKELKTLTKELKIHIDLIVQPRTLREGEKLSPATLRGGAAISQALDNLFIFERVRDENNPNVSKLTLEQARHKMARPGSIYLEYDPVTTRFQEVESVISREAPQIVG